MWRRCRVWAIGPAVAVIAASSLWPVDTADAATNRTRREPVRPSEASSAPLPKGPLYAVIAIAEQRITIYSGTEAVASSRISSGKRGHATPTGVFSTLQKNRFHRSNIYSGAPMPFMQRLTWSGIALHAGVLPGYPASHGCIRLPAAFAQQLFGSLRLGTRVIVASSDVTPETIANPGLPIPTLTAAADVPAPSGPTAALVPSVATASDTAPRLMDPMQLGELEKRRIAAAATQARADVQAAFAAAEAAAREHTAALAAMREGARLVDGLRAQIGAADAPRSGSRAAADAAKAAETAAAAGAALPAAEQALEAARQREAETSQRALDLAVAARTADDAAEAAAEAARAARSRTEPITILVSRKEGKVFVRQGWETVLEAEARIEDPARAIGTHVFKLTAAAIGEDGRPRTAWAALRVPDAAHGADSHQRALERIALPEAARAEIARRLWTGATFMISDNGPGNETGRYTDLIVQTR